MDAGHTCAPNAAAPRGNHESVRSGPYCARSLRVLPEFVSGCRFESGRRSGAGAPRPLAKPPSTPRPARPHVLRAEAA